MNLILVLFIVGLSELILSMPALSNHNAVKFGLGHKPICSVMNLKAVCIECFKAISILVNKVSSIESFLLSLWNLQDHGILVGIKLTEE